VVAVLMMALVVFLGLFLVVVQTEPSYSYLSHEKLLRVEHMHQTKKQQRKTKKQQRKEEER
jgi:hypothetical protein